MLIYKDKNFRVEKIEVVETTYDLQDEFAEIIYESEAEMKKADIAIHILRDIKAFQNTANPYLYVYLHRSHRGWKVDGFLSIDLGNKLLKRIAKIKNKVAEFNKVKLEAINKIENEASNQFITKVTEVLDHIKTYGYHVGDNILHGCSTNVLAMVIARMSDIFMTIRSIVEDDNVAQSDEWEGLLK